MVVSGTFCEMQAINQYRKEMMVAITLADKKFQMMALD